MLCNVDFIYPIGSIYISVNSTNPSILFGGTWEAITGRFLMAGGKPQQNTNTNHGTISNDELTWEFVYGQTLGEYRHKLTTNEMPVHNHIVTLHGTGGDQGLEGLQAPVVWRTDMRTSPYGGISWDAGGDQVHNNIPPCLVVYMWKRIA